MESRPTRRSCIRWLRNPVASVLLFGVLVGDVFTLPGGPRGSTVGQVVERAFSTPRIWNYPQNDIYILKESGGLRVINPETESWGELADALYSGETPGVVCNLIHAVNTRGFWSMTSKRTIRGIRIEPLGGQWTEQELADARAALFGEQSRTLPSWEWIEGFEDVAAEDVVTTRILWGGIVHNAFALTILSGLLYSFTGWPSWFASRSRKSRRIARGCCPSCGYDLQGLTTTTCPECGIDSTMQV